MPNDRIDQSAKSARIFDFRPFAAPLLLFVIISAVNPIAYVGGGGDEWYYLQAARCAALEGLCLPETHWAARHMLTLPVGWLIGLFGEDPLTIIAVQLLYSVGALVLFTAVLQRRFGPMAAAIGGCALVATPAFTSPALHLNIDIVEFFWVMASVFAFQSAARTGNRSPALSSGALLAVAMLSRASSITLVPLFLLAFPMVSGNRRFLAVPFVIGLAAVLGLNAVIYWWMTSNPFYDWMLSMHHTTIPSTELAASVDLRQSPLFNPSYIAGWRRPLGIEVHWTIDPILNLVAHPDVTLTLIGALVLGIAAKAERAFLQPLLWLSAAAALHFAMLTYALAIDPKPRMFLVEIAVAASAIGVFGSLVWRQGGKLVVVMLLAIMTAMTVLASCRTPDLHATEKLARRWVAEERRPVALTLFASRSMTLDPVLRRLPVHPAPGVRTVIGVATSDCIGGAGGFGVPPGWTLERQASFSSTPSRLIGGEPVLLCLFRRS